MIFLSEFNLAGGYDLLVSNPPYVPYDEREDLEAQVRDWEPAESLFVPSERPLIFYEAIAARAWHLLRPGGRLFIELHSRYAAQVRALFEGGAYDRLRLCCDLNGRLRWLEARRS